MNQEQKIVAIGAASGVVLMALSVWLLTLALPSPRMMGTIADRLGYALRANVVALLPLFIMIITIANSRFLSEALDPTRQAESPTMQIDGRELVQRDRDYGCSRDRHRGRAGRC